MSKKLRGLFDEQERLSKLSQKRDPLERLERHINFDFFRKALTFFFDKGIDRSKGGRPAYDYVLMFKILVLQRYYNLSDDTTEYAILDRLSFMRFLGLGINDPVPDAKTIWLFRDNLAREGMVETLFAQLDKQLDKDGIIIHKGKIIDASIVEVPIQRNSRDENNELKEGKTPDWSEPKARQKDTDAQWVKKNKQQFFGYKNHIKVDRKSKLITGYRVSSANIPDKDMLEELLDKKEDAGQCLYADSAYRSKEIEQVCVKNNIKSRIHYKGYRYKKLTEKQRRSNTSRSRVRARVEHVFGFMTNNMNGMYLRYRNLCRNQAAIGLMNLTYNLFRLVQLEIALKK